MVPMRISGRILAALDRPLDTRDFVAVFLVALAVRLINVWLMAGHDAWFEFPDSRSYLAGGAQWLAHGSLSGYLDGHLLLPTERTPGYFWFLSGVMHFFGAWPAAIAAIQGIADAGTCVLIVALARRLGAGTARLTGVAAALWPNLIIHSALILQDTVFLFFLSAFLVLVVEFAARPTAVRCAIAGLVFGAAFLFRAVVMFLPLLLPFVFAGMAWRRSRRPVLAVAAPMLFLLFAALPLSPLLYRNATVFDTVAPTTQAGLHALFWTVSLIHMDENGTTFDEEAERTRRKFEAWLQARGIDQSQLDPFALDRLRREMAFEEIAATPLLRLAKVWAQGAIINLLSPSLLADGRVRSLPRPSFYATPGTSLPARAWSYFFNDPGTFQVLVLVGLASSLLVAMFELWGLWALWARSRLASIGAILFVGYFLAISGPTAGPKYRMPIEPVMVVLFALGADRAIRRFASQPASSPAAGPA